MSLIQELKRRNVFRVGIAYVLMGWVLLQGMDFALDLVGAPEWVIRTLSILVLAGLPVALFVAWAFELTPEGIKRDSDVPRNASIAPQTSRKLDRAIIVALVIAVALLLGERFMSGGRTPPSEDLAPETTAVTAGAAKSIAVLPFVNMSADQDNEYFSDGVSEEILNVLADVPELKVAARTSAFVFKGSDLGIAEIASKLGVAYVLEGSVRKAGDQVRITAQLIQAEDGFHVWSETYDRELDNIFAIQDEIAGNIAEVLQVRLLGERKPFMTIQDLSPENYEKFLKARFLMRRRNEESLTEACRLGEELVANVPDFPLGMTQLAECLVQVDEDSAYAVELTENALRLDPELGTAYMLQGELAKRNDEPVKAWRLFRKAIDLDPTEPRPHHWMGILLAEAGHLEEARRELQMAVDLEPDHANANGYLGLVEMLLGDMDAASRHFDAQVQLGNPLGASRPIHKLAMQGKLEAASRLTEESDGIDGLKRGRLRHFLAAMSDPSRLDDYLDYLRANETNWWEVGPELFMLGLYELAYDDDLMGDDAIKFSWAERWADARDVPAFQAVLQRRNFMALWDEIGPPPLCRSLADAYDCSTPTFEGTE